MIRWDSRRGVGLATIDRPERRNALSAELCDDLFRHLEATDPRQVVVITGADDAFCSGADLVTRFGHGSADRDDTFRPAFERVLDAVVAHPAPVIAAVAGPALGAGLQLAVACDLRVVASNARLGIPAARLGVHLSPANIRRLAQVAGQGTARDVLIGGSVYTGTEALARGLAHRLADDPVADALAWADELAALAPLTLAGHKRALELLARTGDYDATALAEVRELESRAFASEDLREGMAAFAAKRTPRFEGR